MNAFRLTAAWLVLIAMTALYWWWRHPGATVVPGVVILGVALLKVRIVMREFMGIGSAPWPLRRVCDAWLAVTAAGLVGLLAGMP